jgi:RHS repeat-associated protein
LCAASDLLDCAFKLLYGVVATIRRPELHLLQATAGNVITNTFDLRGCKTASSDPDMGDWTYSYDVLSELTSQVDAKIQTTSLYYDLLGRPTQRVESGLTSNWVYDTATDGIGQPTSACTGSGCSTPSNATTFRAYTYDSLGRPSTLGLTVAGSTYTYTTTYDANGSVSTVTYPSGFVAEYDYTSLGYLADIEDHTTDATIWTANSADAELHLTQATAGNNVVTTNAFAASTGRLLNICASTTGGTCNGNVANLSYSWDAIGNLTDRADTYEGYTEEFCYDALNRLTNYAIGSTCTASGGKTVGYDVLGDIISKTDVGTYTYGAGAPGPHAVTSIAGTVNGVVNPTFSYDAKGNMTAGAGRGVTYTSFNMAATVTEGTTTIGFVYGPDHQRAEQCVGGCTNPTATTLYLNGPGNEEKVTSGSSVTWNDYITANGSIVAERFNIAGTVSLLYFTGDHLGSPSVLTNSSGAVVERDSYDAFGKRRNANGTDNTACSITSSTTRGYTEQEMMDSVCEINMNARIYDPTIGRFMSADSMVPNPLNGQSFNRFSYLENNPLNAIDPSGHGDQDSSAPYQYYDGGPPCWGCAGPGEISDQQGNIIPATYGLLANANALTFQWDGNTVTCMTASCVQQTMTQIQGSTTTPTINYEFPQVGITITEQYQTYDAGTAADYTGPGGIETVPVTCGCFQTWTVSGQNGAGFNNGVYYPGQDQGQFIPVVHPIPFVVSQGDIDAAKKNLSAVLRGFSGKPSGPFNGSLSQQQANEIASEIVDNLSLTQAQTLQGIAPQNPLTIDQAQLNIIQSQIGQLTPDVVGVAQAALQSALQSGAVRVNR